MEMKNIPIIRYLVVDKGMSIAAERNVTVDTITQTLTMVLQLLPQNLTGGQSTLDVPRSSSTLDNSVLMNSDVVGEMDVNVVSPQALTVAISPVPHSSGFTQFETIYGHGDFDDDANDDDMVSTCNRMKV